MAEVQKDPQRPEENTAGKGDLHDKCTNPKNKISKVKYHRLKSLVNAVRINAILNSPIFKVVALIIAAIPALYVIVLLIVFLDRQTQRSSSLQKQLNDNKKNIDELKTSVSFIPTLVKEHENIITKLSSDTLSMSPKINSHGKRLKDLSKSTLAFSHKIEIQYTRIKNDIGYLRESVNRIEKQTNKDIKKIQKDIDYFREEIDELKVLKSTSYIMRNSAVM